MKKLSILLILCIVFSSFAFAGSRNTPTNEYLNLQISFDSELMDSYYWDKNLIYGSLDIYKNNNFITNIYLDKDYLADGSFSKLLYSVDVGGLSEGDRFKFVLKELSPFFKDVYCVNRSSYFTPDKTMQKEGEFVEKVVEKVVDKRTDEVILDGNIIRKMVLKFEIAQKPEFMDFSVMGKVESLDEFKPIGNIEFNIKDKYSDKSFDVVSDANGHIRTEYVEQFVLTLKNEDYLFAYSKVNKGNSFVTSKQAYRAPIPVYVGLKDDVLNYTPKKSGGIHLQAKNGVRDESVGEVWDNNRSADNKNTDNKTDNKTDSKVDNSTRVDKDKKDKNKDNKNDDSRNDKKVYF